MEKVNFVTTGGIEALRQRYVMIVVALYPNIDSTYAVAERLIQEKVPAEDISVVVSEGKWRELLEAGIGIGIVPPEAYQGARQQGAVGGAFLGGAAGLLLGAEAVLLGVGAVFALPVLAGAALVGVALGAAWGDTFVNMDLRAETTSYRTHLLQGGALLTVYATTAQETDRIEAILRPTNPSEIEKHPLRLPAHV